MTTTLKTCFECQSEITNYILRMSYKNLCLTPEERHALIQVSTFLGDKEKTGVYSCFPSCELMSEMMGKVSPQRLAARLKKSVELGYLVMERIPGKSYRYTFVGLPIKNKTGIKDEVKEATTADTKQTENDEGELLPAADTTEPSEPEVDEAMITDAETTTADLSEPKTELVQVVTEQKTELAEPVIIEPIQPYTTQDAYNEMRSQPIEKQFKAAVRLAEVAKSTDDERAKIGAEVAQVAVVDTAMDAAQAMIDSGMFGGGVIGSSDQAVQRRIETEADDPFSGTSSPAKIEIKTEPKTEIKNEYEPIPGSSGLFRCEDTKRIFYTSEAANGRSRANGLLTASPRYEGFTVEELPRAA